MTQRILQDETLEELNDAEEAAREAGLRYVNDHKPGIRRETDGDGFRYLDTKGRVIADEKTLARIRSLGIPPAYTDVWISPHPKGHIQATGRDAKGRKQYRYHPEWRRVRDEAKYGRVIAFGLALPRIRARVDHDLSLPGLPREKVLAAVVRLLETTLIRVGNAEYARDNKSYGLTTLRDKHVTFSGDKIRFKFRGKSGKNHNIALNDKRLAKIVKRCRDLPGQELFQYLDEQGEVQDIGSSDVNAYLHEITGEPFTAKDFRTWAGTVIAAQLLRETGIGESQKQAKSNVVRAIEHVAERLGNTPAVCRKCYVHPAILEAYLDNALLTTLAQRAEEVLETAHDLRPEEREVLEFLQQRLASEENVAS